MIVCGPAWYAPVCGGFDQANYFFNPLTNGWQFPVSPYSANYFSAPVHGSSDNIRSNIGRSDKRYFECTIDAKATTSAITVYVGIVLATTSNILAVGTALGTVGYRNTNGDVLLSAAVVATYTAWNTGDTVGLAIDGTTGKVWFSLNGGFNGNPVAGTGPAATLGAGTFYAAVCPDDQGNSTMSVTGRFLTGSTLYAPPSGFNCWDD